MCYLDDMMSKHHQRINAFLGLLYKSTCALTSGKRHLIKEQNSLFAKLAHKHFKELQQDKRTVISQLDKDIINPVSNNLPPRGVEKTSFRRGTEFYLPFWQELTSVSYILQCVAGYRLEFESTPSFEHGNMQTQFSGNAEQEALIAREVEDLLQKQAITPVEKQLNQFVSRLFVVPKKGNQWRAVLNLKPLNVHIEKHHFKMENWWSLRSLLKQGDYMIRLDLKDAFLSIPIHKDSIRFLCFDWKGTRYSWQRLPFGLTSSPRIFTKVLKPVVAFLRRQGIKLSIYMDDLLMWNSDKEKLLEHLKEVIKTLQSLGFEINFEKSRLIPTQIIDFLGFKLDSVNFTMNLGEEKSNEIMERLKSLSGQDKISGRELASILGKLAAASQALLVAPLHFRRLQKIQGKMLRLRGDINYENNIVVQGEVFDELVWWINNFTLIKPAPIAYPRVTLSIKNALLSFGRESRDTSIQIYTDNSSAVAVLRKLGSIRSEKLNLLAMEIWEWAMERNIIVLALRIPGKSNTEADLASRVS
jgi:hypothetical protein